MKELNRYQLTTQDLSILEAQTPKTLAEWWCILNRWECPAELGEAGYRKTTWETNGESLIETTKGFALMKWIEERVAEKLIFRTWNREMTDEEFEKYWQTRRLPNKTCSVR